MNAVEIEEAISRLAERRFEADEFPFAFLEAFGNKPTTIKRLRSGATNNSDLGGVLQRNNIHIKVCPEGEAAATLTALKASPATFRAKAKFALATDGQEFHAEDLNSGDVVVCDYPDFPEHFGLFLPLAGITTVKQIRESAFDIKATGRLNRLYVELLKENPDWGSVDRRHEMNHFMARLIFCFFAEDTDIFNGQGLFTDTIERMSASDSSNTHTVIGEMFRAMNTEAKAETRKAANIPRWADSFPYVNGGLFSDSTDVPRFSRIARSYLLHIGNLDWKKVNPDIFGSMIQAVADDEERGALLEVLFGATARGFRVCVLSGDVHVSAVFSIEDAERRRIYQLTSSAITYGIARPLSWVLSAGAADDGETAEGHRFQRLALYADSSYALISVDPGTNEAWFKLYGKQKLEPPPSLPDAETIPLNHSVAKIQLF